MDEEEYKIDFRTKREIREAVAKIPIETKQKILDMLREGKNIGEIRRALNLPLMEVCEVINQNIYSVSLLNKEAK